MLGSALAALVIAAVTSTGLPGGGTAQAQANEPAEEISRLPGGGGPWTGFNTDASISADGRFVVFNASPASGPDFVTIRDRIGDTTTAVPYATSPPSIPDSQNATISDDGCVIAFSANVINGEFGGYQWVVHNRCSGVSTVASFQYSPTPFPRPAVSADGSVIAWSDGFNIYVFQRTGNNYAVVAAVLPPPGSVAFAAGGTVAMSDDGNLIAYTSGIGGRYNPSPSVVRVWDRRNPAAVQVISRTAAGGASAGNSYGPSISGDGNLVAFYSFATDLAVGPQPANQYFVAVFDRSTSTMRLVANDASEADISRDGRHIAYNLDVGEIGDVYVATSTSPQPFATIATDLVSYSTAGPPNTTFGSASGPVISDRGRWVAFHSYAGDLLSDEPPFFDGWHVYVRQRRPVLAVSPIDFGTVQVGNSFDLPSTVTNLGLSGFVVTSIAASGGFAVLGENCPDVLDRGQSCTVTVRYTPAAAVVSTGQLTVRDDSYAPVPLAYSAALRGTGSAVAVTTTLPVATTTTAPTVPTPFSLAIEPAAIAFEAQTVGVASPTQAAQVRNTGTGSNTVGTVSVGGTNAADFAVVSTNCVGAALAPGATCDVELGFTPTDAGARTAQLTATGQGGSSAAATLTGDALYAPTLEAFPPVAAPGQVTTLIGDGFPPSTPIEMVWEAGPEVFSITSDATGSFKLPVLILVNTLLGPRIVSAVAQPGRFDQVDTDLLIVAGTIQPQGTGGFVQLVTNHVSRG
ncbi:MAG TPA: choice-of-anchor D domain-containing protein [Ilumatobacteraceae bacterium]|nr:choice-of-anchor D domain-containing protein [Ilumatobacteraceae bacterium]